MKIFTIIFLLLISTTILAATTVTAFKSGERVTGQTKQCYYKYAGSTYTRTVKSYQLCPLSIKVKV